MAQAFKFPDIGEGIEEGEVVRWFIKEGDQIKEHQVVAEVETDKAVAEIPSPYTGTVLKINVKPGQRVKVGEVLFVVGKKGEKIESVNKKEPTFTAAGAVGYLEEAPEEDPLESKSKSLPKAPSPKTLRILATPVIRSLAKKLGVDLNTVTPTGEKGRVTEADLQKAAKTPEQKPKMVVKRKYDLWGYVDRIPLKGLRKSIAEQMIKAVQHAPQVTMMDEVVIDDLAELKDREKIKAKKKGIHLTYLPFIAKACLAALKEFPLLNATLDEEQQEIIVKKYYNFGFAVDINGEGLLVPVVKGVDQKDVSALAQEIHQLADKARKRTLDLQEMRGGTFTITNFGSVGSQFSTPIINYPEVAILGLGRIYQKPIALKQKIVIRKILPLSLSFDHRVVDGAYATRFLNALLDQLRSPQKLLQ